MLIASVALIESRRGRLKGPTWTFSAFVLEPISHETFEHTRAYTCPDLCHQFRIPRNQFDNKFVRSATIFFCQSTEREKNNFESAKCFVSCVYKSAPTVPPQQQKLQKKYHEQRKSVESAPTQRGNVQLPSKKEVMT